ncbi:Asp23/Gls24 family envelope stress response protein [Chloroflexota bacterium]
MAGEEIKGETIIQDEVVASIVGVAAKEVEGVADLGKSSIRRKITERLAGTPEKSRIGVGVEVGEKEAIVDLELDVVYGFNIPKIVNEVRQKVASRLLEITGLVAKEINVNVVGIEFSGEKLSKKVGRVK